jgi:hypothetical protein
MPREMTPDSLDAAIKNLNEAGQRVPAHGTVLALVGIGFAIVDIAQTLREGVVVEDD